ncbi:MAG TPA: gluconate kinase, partial [Hyphomonas sp.]|nr:gluconate kinase [Hyphomonas sp.]
MGVAGSGKTSIAEALSKAEGWPFVEADDYHSAANKEKMASGTPLTDADRADWVRSLCKTLTDMPEDRVVLACSALTPFVQTGLREQSGRTCLFVLLDVPKDELAR